MLDLLGRHWRLHFNSLRVQLLIWVALPAAIVLLVISSAEIRGHERAMQQLAQERADGLAEAVAALVGARVDRGKDVLLQMAGDPAIRAMEEPFNVATSDERLPDSSLFSLGIAVLDLDGTTITNNGQQFWLTWPETTDLADQVVTSETAKTIAVHSEDGWRLLQAVPIRADSNAADALLIGAMPLRSLALTDMVSRLALRTNADLQIQTSDGSLLFEFNQNEQTLRQENADRTVSAQTMIEPLGWKVFLTESWAELVPPLMRFENIMLLVIAMAALVSVLAFYFSLHNIVQPLRRLDDAAGQVAWGNYEPIESPVGGVQEVEDLRLALARMAAQLRQYQQELQSYIGAMTLGQEEERRRLARELHDETIQGLIALNQQVEIIERRMVSDPQDATQRLRALRPLLSETISGLRRQIHGLRPLYLEDLGFVTALEMLVKQTGERHKLVSDFNVIGPSCRRLAPATEICAYRIVQEALQNVANHARASWVHVELDFDDVGVTVRVEDNGHGFAVPPHLYQQAQEGHFGLLGMQERAQLNAGSLRIESEVGHGTRVIARLPAPEEI